MNAFDMKNNPNSSDQLVTHTDDPAPFFKTEEGTLPLTSGGFETIQDESFRLSYACLIIPCFPSHLLKGDLADYLPGWLHHICHAHTWTMGFHEVMPGYLHWVLTVPASESPKHFMRVLRYKTSKMIFSYFGRIQRECLGQDFWAPGHLIAMGNHPHSEDWIENFIRSARHNQGLDTL